MSWLVKLTKVLLIMGIGSVLWLFFKNLILTALMFGTMMFQAATWNDGKGMPTKSIELKIPETNTTLAVFARRSHPSQPEFDRWMEVRTAGEASQRVDLVPDTSGANIIDVFVVRHHMNLEVHLTSPFFYRMENRLVPDKQRVYPDISDGPSPEASEAGKEFEGPYPRENSNAKGQFPQQNFWVLYTGSFPAVGDVANSRFAGLTKIGQFDTRYATWTDALTSGSL